MTVFDLVKVLKKCPRNLEVFAISPNGSRFNLSENFYIADETCYFFAKNNDEDNQLDTKHLWNFFEEEAEKDCWTPDELLGMNKFLDCDLGFLISAPLSEDISKNPNSYIPYNIDKAIRTKYTLKLICSEN